MITEKVTVLKADEGMTLTNGEAFGKVVYLGKNDSPDNWHEITDEEAMALQENGEIDG
ncbi:MAG: hypothetical protein IIV47_05000 [Clostridia bacterium]|nr:hypothetical protein [Clostridia bacterium]